MVGVVVLLDAGAEGDAKKDDVPAPDPEPQPTIQAAVSSSAPTCQIARAEARKVRPWSPSVGSEALEMLLFSPEKCAGVAEIWPASAAKVPREVPKER